jgi:outer membrane protein insertion porin family
VIFSSLFGIVFAALSFPGTPIPILEIDYSSRRDDVTINEDKIRQNMRSTQGGVYSQQVVDGDIALLYETGDYSNVQICTTEVRAENGERGVRLTVIVEPRVRVSEVEVKRRRPDGGLDDNLSVKREELLGVQPTSWETIGVPENASRAKGTTRKPAVTKVGEILREERLYRDAVAMEECYLEKGYKDVRVTPKTVAAKGEDKVVFEVEEGEQGFIGEVRFIGNQAVREEELKKVISLKPASWRSGKEDSNCLRIEKLEIDLDRVEDLYQNKGFLDVQVTASVHRFGELKNKEETKKTPRAGLRANKEDLILQYRIQEGQRYGVEKISVSGNSFFDEKDILDELKNNSKGQWVFDPVGLKMVQVDGLTRGRAFSVNGLQASLETLQNMYGRKGFREVRVTWKMEPLEKKGDCHVHFEVTEGEKFVVDKIEIQGNRFTKDEVIRREIQLAPGDVFDTGRERLSKKNLEGLNLFSSIETYAMETEDRNRQKLIVKVQEKPKNLTFGCGVSFFWAGTSDREILRLVRYPFIFIFTGPKDWESLFEPFRAWMAQMQRKFLTQRSEEI